ncbi:hypothetical protein K151_2729 [Proteus hauseri ZMd44]|uniref:hypothetical protein n=1 Tax=Proteus cibi TaxID=2050966 RepID=UPI0003C62B33|nr:hypothetical protein K151_2729 [Proteus hauseri ZMd44]
MANKILFPIKKTPSFESVLDVLIDGFNELSFSTQQITIGLSAKKGLDLSDRFLYIKEHRHGCFCWVSFNYFEPEYRDKDDIDYPIMVGIKTRGELSQKFAVLVTYILAKKLNARIIYDDAYLVQKKESYSINELSPFIEQYVSVFNRE